MTHMRQGKGSSQMVGARRARMIQIDMRRVRAVDWHVTGVNTHGHGHGRHTGSRMMEARVRAVNATHAAAAGRAIHIVHEGADMSVVVRMSVEMVVDRAAAAAGASVVHVRVRVVHRGVVHTRTRRCVCVDHRHRHAASSVIHLGVGQRVVTVRVRSGGESVGVVGPRQSVSRPMRVGRVRNA